MFSKFKTIIKKVSERVFFYGKNRAKIAGFKKQKNNFALKNPTYHDFCHNVTRNGG